MILILLGLGLNFGQLTYLDASKKFEEIYGENKIYSLHNEEDANTPRNQ